MDLYFNQGESPYITASSGRVRALGKFSFVHDRTCFLKALWATLEHRDAHTLISTPSHAHESTDTLSVRITKTHQSKSKVPQHGNSPLGQRWYPGLREREGPSLLRWEKTVKNTNEPLTSSIFADRSQLIISVSTYLFIKDDTPTHTSGVLCQCAY